MYGRIGQQPATQTVSSIPGSHIMEAECMHMRAGIHVTGAFGEWWHPAHHLASPPFGRPPSHGPLLPPPVPTKDHAIQIIELRLHRCTLMPPHHSSHHHVLCVLSTRRTIEQHPLLPRCALARLPSPSPDPTPPTSASASIPRSSAAAPHPVRAVTRPKRLALDGVRHSMVSGSHSMRTYPSHVRLHLYL